MALGDVQLYDQAAFGYPGSEPYDVAPSATTIKAGEPVVTTRGTNVVSPLQTGAPLVGTDFMVGIAATTSTNTSTATGTVQVTKFVPGMTFLCAPTTAASWDTQAEYTALVGKRVLFGLSAGVYTVGATDSSSNGLVVEKLDIAEVPGKVRFSIRNAVSYLA